VVRRRRKNNSDESLAREMKASKATRRR